MPHNGKRIQTNPSFLGFPSTYPFMNILKEGGIWAFADNHVPYDVFSLDTNGWPTVDGSHGGSQFATPMPSQVQRAGQYVVKWDNGDSSTAVSISTSDYPVGGNSVTFNFSGSSGRRFTYTPNSSNQTTTLRIVTTGSPYARNFRVCHINDETAMDGGEIFQTKFLSFMQQVGAIRFLDWQSSNGTNITKWAQRRPVTYANYQGNQWPASLLALAGVTTSTGTTYAVTISGFSLVDKVQILVAFDHDQGASAGTLNVNGTGPKTICDGYAIPMPSTTHSGVGVYGSFGQYAVCTYDASLDVWLCESEQFNTLGIDDGVPPEICYQLCLEAGAHPWFCAPYLTVDCGTGQLPSLGDYMTSLATYVSGVQPSWMVPKYETCNETWNSGLGFKATRYGWAKQQVRSSVVQDTNNWVGTIGSILGQGVSTVYSGNTSRYNMIIGFGAYNSNPPASNAARVESTYYVTQGGNAAQSYCTHICWASYFNSRHANTAYMATLAYQYATGVPGTLAAYVGACSSIAYDGALEQGGFSIPQFVSAVIPNYISFAASKGFINTHYEGGYSPDFWFDTFLSIGGVTKGATTKLTSLTVGDVYPKTGFANAAVGSWVMVEGVGGMTELNAGTGGIAGIVPNGPGAGGLYKVTAADDNSITINVNSTGFTTFTSGGRVHHCNVATITGISRGATTTISVDLIPFPNSTQLTGLGFCVAGVGGTTGLNGNIYSCASATSSSITLNVDSTAMSNWTSGGFVIYNIGGTLNQMQLDSKFDSAVVAQETLMFQALLDSGNSVFPSEYSFAAPGSPFSMFTDIYQSPTPPRWQAVLNWDSGTGPTSTAIQRPRIKLR